MKKCPKCGRRIQEEAAFCGNCGAKLARGRYLKEPAAPKKKRLLPLILILVLLLIGAVCGFFAVRLLSDGKPAEEQIPATEDAGQAQTEAPETEATEPQEETQPDAEEPEKTPKQLILEKTSCTDGSGYISKYEYNAMGQLIGKASWYKGKDSEWWDLPDIVVYSYDSRGNVAAEYKSTSVHTESTVHYTYDEGGRVIRKEEVPSGNWYTYAYDGQGNLIQETYGASGITRYSEYDANGRCIKHYGVDAEGIMIDSTETVYDPQGNEVESISRWYDDEGKVCGSEGSENVYDDQGHLLSTTYLFNGEPSGGNGAVYTYDDNWNLIRAETKFGDMHEICTYTYDGQNRIVLETSDMNGMTGSTAYVFDEEGDLIRKEVTSTGYSSDAGYEIVETTEYVYQSAQEETGDTSWKAGYLEFLDNGALEINEYADCYLTDLDGDKVPELYLDLGSYASGMALCAFDGEEVNYLHLQGGGGLSWIPGTGLVLNTSGHQGVYAETVYQVKDGQIMEVARGTWMDLEYLSQFDSEATGSRTWNEEPVSETEYYEKRKEAFDDSRAESILPLSGTDPEYWAIPYSTVQFREILAQS